MSHLTCKLDFAFSQEGFILHVLYNLMFLGNVVSCVKYGHFVHPEGLEEQSRTAEERRSRNVPLFSGASPEGVCCQKLFSAATLQCQELIIANFLQDRGEADKIAHTPCLNRW